MRLLLTTILSLLFSFGLMADPITGVVTNASMANCSDGAINITVTGGVAPYTFQWSNGASSEDLSNIKPGHYSVTVTDALCGTATQSFNVGNNGNNFYIAGKENIEDCSKFETYGSGSIDLAVPAGTFTYSWSGPNGFTANTQDITDLSRPGDYTVTITNAAGCTTVLTEHICCCVVEPDEPHPGGPVWEPPAGWKCASTWSSPPITNITAVVHSPSTPTSGDGSINITVSGGNYDKIYNWTGPNGYMAHTQDISGLSAPGTYCVTVTDGCSTFSKCFTLVICSNSTLTLNGSVTNTCQGYSTGSVTVGATGGVSPYSYKWNTGQTSATISNLPAGQYCVTLTDAAGCSQNKCFTVSNGTITREGCSIYCDGKLIETKESHYVFDPSDCRYIKWYCSDGYYLGREYVGYKVDINPFSCTLSFYCQNGQLLASYPGYDCTDCILFQDGSYIVCCHVNYCYFPDLDVSYVKSIHEHKSVTTIQIGDGLCNLEVWDDCAQPIEQLLDENVPCNQIPYHDSDCYYYFQVGDFIEGAFGNCSGFSPDNPTTSKKSANELLNGLTISEFKVDRSHHLPEVEKFKEKQIRIKEGSTCADATISFPSERAGKAQIELFNMKNMLTGKYEFPVSNGMNNINLQGLLAGQDSMVLNVTLPDKSLLVKLLALSCPEDVKSNFAGGGQANKNNVSVYPNPTSGEINVNIALAQPGIVTLKVDNSLGETIGMENVDCVKGNNLIKVDLSNRPAGSYILTVIGEKGTLKTERVVKQ